MIRAALVLLVASLPVPAAAADTAETAGKTYASDGELLDLIDENRRALTRGMTLSDNSGAPVPPPSNVWIHIRDAGQLASADKIAAVLEDGVHLGPVTREVDFRPVQEVAVGPDTAQVRYFRREDQTTAFEIASRLRAEGLDIEARSFVDAFADASYIQVGHIEIWLPETMPAGF